MAMTRFLNFQSLVRIHTVVHEEMRWNKAFGSKFPKKVNNMPATLTPFHTFQMYRKTPIDFLS